MSLVKPARKPVADTELAPCPLCAKHHTPNAETIQAMKEVEAGNLKSAESFDELMAILDEKD